MRVSRRGMNGGMNDMNGGMNEGLSVTTRHPPRRAHRPRHNERAAPRRASFQQIGLANFDRDSPVQVL